MRTPLVTTLGLFWVWSLASAGMFDQKLLVNGAGATFPYPLYSKWFSEYQKIKPHVAFNYQSIGSGGGIRQLLDETVDFGASDAPMSDEQLKKAKGPVIHVPGTMGAVVLSYHLDSITKPLRFTGKIVADIFLGKITTWDHPDILAINEESAPELRALKFKDILVVHRADGSGTTSIFSEYLCKSSDEWKTKVGKGNALRWPVGIGGKGNEGVSSFIKQIPGSIGYVELVFAKTLKLKMAHIQNQKGEFVEASPTSVTASAMGALKQIPDDFRTSLTNVNASGAYPISAFTYILVYDQMKKGEKREALFQFLRWALREGQTLGLHLNYAPLPPPLIDRIITRLNQSDEGVSK